MRRVAGTISLILGLAAWYVVEHTEPITHGYIPPRHATAEHMLSVLILAWISLSIITKLSMVLNEKRAALNVISLVAWILILGLAAFAGSNGAVPSLLQIVAGTFLFLVWPLVDMVDAAIILSTPRPLPE